FIGRAARGLDQPTGRGRRGGRRASRTGRRLPRRTTCAAWAVRAPCRPSQRTARSPHPALGGVTAAWGGIQSGGWLASAPGMWRRRLPCGASAGQNAPSQSPMRRDRATRSKAMADAVATLDAAFGDIAALAEAALKKELPWGKRTKPGKEVELKYHITGPLW